MKLDYVPHDVQPHSHASSISSCALQAIHIESRITNLYESFSAEQVPFTGMVDLNTMDFQ